MSKPTGLSLGIGSEGLRMRVNVATKTEDAIWDAVETAVIEGWTPEQFRMECAEAWEHRLREDAKHAKQVLSR